MDLTLSRIENSTGAVALAVEKNLLYAAGRTSLSVYDISIPDHPVLLGHCSGIASGRQIAVRNGIVYVTGRSFGLWIIDARDPHSPRIAANFETAELATGIDLCGEILFIAERVYGIEIFSVKDPFHPQFLSRFTTDEAQSCRYQEGFLYVGDWLVGKLTVLDVHDLTKVQHAGTGFLDGFGDGLFPMGDKVYISTGHHAKYSLPESEREGNGRGMEVFDITNPCDPKRLGGIKFPRFLRHENDYWTLRVSGNTAFCADSHNGFYLVDVSDPGSLFITGEAHLPAFAPSWETPEVPMDDCVANLVLADGYVYLAGLTTGIWFFAHPDAAHFAETRPFLSDSGLPAAAEIPKLLRAPLEGNIRRVAFSGNRIFAACGEAGLFCSTLTGKGIPGCWEKITGAMTHDVKCQDQWLVTAEDHVKLVIREKGKIIGEYVSNVESPVRIVHLYGKRAVCSGGAGHILILDLSNPASIRLLYRGGIPGLLYCDMMPNEDFNGFLPVNWHYSGLPWFRIDSEKPEMVIGAGCPVMGFQLDGIEKYGKNLITAFNSQTLGITSAEEMGKPLRTLSLSGDLPLSGIPTADGTIAAFADRRNGRIVTLDLADPDHPHEIPERCYIFPAGTICERVTFHQGKMFIPAGRTGLFFEA